MLKNVLFDLDGTLLPMDQDTFVEAYFGGLTQKLAPYGYEPKKLIDGVWSGTEAMVHNDGTRTNEAVFWEKFASIFGERIYADKDKFEDFYQHEFDNAASVCGFDPLASEVIKLLKSQNRCIVLATNPIFPAVATYKRVRWAGLDPSDFALITTYENIGFCKPNPSYYTDILNRMKIDPKETMMVGNDVGEDMVAARLGMKVFLVTDCLIDRGKDISVFDKGSLFDLISLLKQTE